MLDCCRTGYDKSERFRKKCEKWKEDVSERNEIGKVLDAVLTRDEHSSKLALTATLEAFIDSCATAHMMKGVSVATCIAVQ